jgi:hypothetical protein
MDKKQILHQNSHIRVCCECGKSYEGNCKTMKEWAYSRNGRVCAECFRAPLEAFLKARKQSQQSEGDGCDD